MVQGDAPSPDVIGSRERALRVVTAQTQDVGQNVERRWARHGWAAKY